MNKFYNLLGLALAFLISSTTLNAQNVTVEVDGENVYYNESGCDDCNGAADPRWRNRVIVNGTNYDWNVDRDGFCGWSGNTNYGWTPSVTAGSTSNITIQMNGYESDGFICGGDDYNCGGYSTTSTVPINSNPPCQWNYDTDFRTCGGGGTYGLQYSYYWYYQSLFPGSVTSNQTICYNGDPNNLSSTDNGSLWMNYQWEYSDNNGGSWNTIGGATGASYDPPAGLTNTRWYRRVGSTCGGAANVTTNVIIVTVLPQFIVGPISGGGGTICAGGNPGSMSVSPSGANGSYNYQWYQVSGSGCPSGGGASAIGGANGSTYDPPAGLATTTSYQVQVDPTGSPDCGGFAWSSNCITVTVNPLPVVTPTNSAPSICSGQNTAISFSSNVGSTTFNWTAAASSVNIGGFANGSGSSVSQTLTNSGNTPGTVTYTVTGTAAGCPGSPVTVVVTVNPSPTATITPNAQIICSGNATSLALTSNVGGATFAWTATGSAGVSGFTGGSGTNIAQTLDNSGSANGTATYTVTATANGCPGASSQAVVTVLPSPNGNIVGVSPLCTGLSTTITFNFTQGTGPFNITYTDGTSNFNLVSINSGHTISVSPTTATTYSFVSISDANGCPRNSGFGSSATIAVNPLPNGDISGTTTICQGDATDLTFNFTSGTAPFDVQYTDGTTTFSLNGISNGATASVSPATTATYSLVSITDANGCVRTNGFGTSAIITVNPAPNATIALNSPICQGQSTTLTFTFTAGSGPYNVAFTDGITNFSLTGISTGATFVTTPPTTVTYNFTSIQDLNGCTRTSGFAGNAQVLVNPLPIVSFTGLAATYCETNANVTITGNQAPGGTFSGTGITNNGNGTAIFSPATAGPTGPYVVTYTFTDINTCTNSTTQSVSIFEQPVANAGPDGAECDLTFTFGAIPTVGTGTWTLSSGPGTAFFSNANSPTSGVQVSAFGTYVFDWTEVNGLCNDVDQATVVFTQQSVANAGTGGNECDLTFVFSAVPTVGVGTWSQTSGPGTTAFSNANSATATATASIPGAYTYQWEESNGTCTSNATVTVNYFEQPVADAGTGGDECDLNFVFSAIPSAGTGTWTQVNGPGTSSFSNANSATATVTVSVFGAYTFRWTEVNGTCNSQDDVTINFFNQPVANAGLGGDECDLTFAFSATTPTVGTGTWTQTTGPGTTTFNNANSSTATATASAVGTYTYTWTVVNGTCSSNQTVTVNYWAQPVAEAGPGGSECDLTFALAAVPSVGTGTWTQVSGPGTSSFSAPNSATATVTVSAVGTYVFRWTEVNGTCSAQDNVSVTFSTQPSASAGNDGNECDLTFTFNAIGSVGGGSWAQTSGPGFSNFSNVASPTATVTASQFGSYVYTWTELNGVCTSSDQVTVNYFQQPVANAGSDGNECDLNFVFNASPSAGTGTWTQVTGPGTSSFSNANSASATVTVSATGAYTYQWQEVNGTCTAQDQVSVNFFAQPVANAGLGGNECDLNFVCSAVPSVGTGTWTQVSGPGTSSFSNANSATATITVSVFGSYVFRWTEVNGTCTSNQSITVNFNQQSVANAGTGGNECDLTFTFNATPSVGTGVWTASGPGSAFFSNANSASATVTVGQSGTYLFTWTETNGTCISSGNVTVNFFQQPVANAGTGGNECDLDHQMAAVPSVTGSTGQWTATGPGTVSYFPNANAANAIATVSAFGAYQFTWTEVNGTCTSTASITVNFFQQPVALAGADGNECDLNFVFAATAANAGTGTWTQVSGPGTSSFSSANSATATVTASTFGTYVYRWTIVNGTCTAQDEVTVNYFLQPIANAGTGGNECDLNFLFSATTPNAGVGTWTQLSGPGTTSFNNSNSPNATATVTVPGAYTFQWTVVNGTCNNSQSVTVNFFAQPVANAGTGGNECDLNFVFSAVPSVGTGTWTQVSGPGTSTFSNANSATATATVSTVGTYVFRWTEVNGTCSSNQTVSVTFNQQPVANAGSGGTVCTQSYTFNGVGSVGTGTWTATGPGSALFANVNSPTSTVNVTAFGTYQFTWTVVNGTCTAAQTISVIFTQQPVANAGNNASECSQSHTFAASQNVGTGTWTTQSGPGTANFANANSATSSVTVTTFGVYTFRWTVTNGTCTAFDDVVITFNPLPVVSISGLAASYCIDAAAANLTGTPAGGAFTGPGMSGTLFTPSSAGVGTHTVVYTFTDANACTNAQSQSVTVNPTPIVSFSGLATSYCVSDQVAHALIGSPAGGTFTGTGIAGGSFTASVAGVGTYVITYTSTNSSGCSASSTATTTVNFLPVVSFTGLNPTYCTDATAATLVGNPASGTFSGPGVSGTTFNPLTAGAGTHTITYTFTNANGCTNTSTQSVVVNPLPVPVISPAGNQNICDGASLVLNAGAGFGTYAWSNSQSGQTTSVSSGGPFTVTVTTLAGCTATSAPVNITVIPAPAVDLGPDQTLCTGGSLTLDAGNPGATYLWSTTQTSQTISITALGTYTVTVTNSNGCTGTDQISVSESNTITPSVTASGPIAFCNGGSVTLDAGTGYTSYLWSTGAQSQTVTITSGQTVTVQVTNVSGCTGTSAPVTTTVLQLPNAAVSANGPLTLCPGEDVTLFAANAFATYSWNPGGAVTQFITVTQAGTYVLTVTDPNNGCVNTSSAITVTNVTPQAPNITANGPLEFCFGGSVVLNAGVGFSSYLWNTGSTNQSITVTQSGDYGLTVLDLNGCIDSTYILSPVTVTVWQPIPVISEQNGTLTVTNGPFVTYQWFRNGVPVPGEVASSITPTQSGNFSVQVTDENGCSGTAVIFEFTFIGIAEDEAGWNIDLYPNPSNGLFTLEVATEQATTYSLAVRDVMGRDIIKPEQITNSRSLRRSFDMTGMAKGVYQLMLVSEDATIVRKLIID